MSSHASAFVISMHAHFLSITPMSAASAVVYVLTVQCPVHLCMRAMLSSVASPIDC